MANKAELVDRVAKKTQLTKKDVSATVEALFETIQEALKAGEKVQVIGFGNFEVRERAARKGRNFSRKLYISLTRIRKEIIPMNYFS